MPNELRNLLRLIKSGSLVTIMEPGGGLRHKNRSDCTDDELAMAADVLTVIMDKEGFCQPLSSVRTWLRIEALLADGWRVLALSELERQEITVVLWRYHNRSKANGRSEKQVHGRDDRRI